MEEFDRIALVQLELSKADKFFQQAIEMMQLTYWDLAANRFYYACFHAVQALFIHDELNCHTHHGLHVQFAFNYVKTEKFPARFGALLTTMEQIREKGDYNCKIEVTALEVQEMQVPSNEFISSIKEYINKG